MNCFFVFHFLEKVSLSEAIVRWVGWVGVDFRRGGHHFAEAVRGAGEVARTAEGAERAGRGELAWQAEGAGTH